MLLLLVLVFAWGCGSDDGPQVNATDDVGTSDASGADMSNNDVSVDLAEPDMGVDMQTDTQDAEIPNDPPVADAGMDQTGLRVGDVVRLTAAFSTDPDGDELTFLWTQTGGATVVLDTPELAATTFTAISPAGDYEFLVTVSDGRASSQDSVTVNVTNRLPEANAGIAQVVQVGQLVTLDGSQSSDGDGEALTYSWVQSAGESVVLTGETTVSPTFTAPAVFGDLIFDLTVSDGQATGFDRTSVTIENLAPIAEAGANQNVAKGDFVTLNGSGMDPENQPITYAWTQVSGPSTVILSDDTVAQPTFTAPLDVAGAFVFELVVNDGNADSVPDRTRVVTPNSPPVADAGVDSLVNGGEVVFLDGRASADPDGDPFRYEWTQTSGTTVDFGNGDRARAYFKAPSAINETLTFQLKVTNGQGTDTDSVSFTTTAWAGTAADIPINPFATTLEPFTSQLYAVGASGNVLVTGGTGGQKYVVYDVSDPASPIQTAAAAPSVDSPFVLDFNGTQVIAGVGASIQVLEYTGTALNVVGTVPLPGAFNSVTSIARFGDTVYAAIFDGTGGVFGIAAFDIQTPTSPALLHYEIVTDAKAVTARNNELWVGANNTLTGYDTSSIRTATPAFVAMTDAADDKCSSTPRRMQIVGNLLYATCSTWADLAIFDITTPADPNLLATLNVPGTGEDIVVDGTKAYVASRTNGVLVFDVAVPATPVFLGNLPTSGESSGVAYLPTSQTIASRSGDIVDLLEPSIKTPEFAASVPFVGDPYNVTFVSGFVGVQSQETHILDVSDLNNITTESTIFQNSDRGLIVDYPLLFASTGSRVSIVDISVPSSPLTLSTIQGNATYDQIALRNDTLYIAADTSGVLIYDVSNPSVPALLGSYSTGADYVGVLIDGTTLYATAWADGIHVLEVSNPAMPTEIAYRAFTSPKGRMEKSGDYLWSGYGANSIFRYDISDPTNPSLAVLNLNTSVEQIRVNGALAWIATGAAGVMTVDVSDIANPVVLERYAVSNVTKHIAIGDDEVWFSDDKALRGIRLENARWLARFQTGAASTTLAYPIAWEEPVTDATVQCFVSGGTCTVGSLDLVNRTATISWTLPAAGDHEIAVVVGHASTRAFLRDRITVTP